MKKNRAEKIVVKQEREWSEQEVQEKKRIVEAIFGKNFSGRGNAPPSGEKLSGK